MPWQWQWLQTHVRQPKDASYAPRVLDRFRLGMKAHGAIRGVRILPGSDLCPVCRDLSGTVYHPDDVPIIPLAGCPQPGGCRCAYTPVMAYEEAST
jgi:hypothetical protein